MIIKSMSRKAPTFKQLVKYIGQNSDPQTGSVFARNLYYTGGNADLVTGQFWDNYQYLPRRKNGNALYHEVIVLEPQDHMSKAQIEAALHKLAETYCAKRAPHQLAWGRVHWDTDYPHIHLMISSNAVRSDRRVRMEKAQFAQVQKTLEAYKEERFPELNGGRIYQKDKTDRTKITMAEGELVRRTKQPSAKQAVVVDIKTALSRASGQSQIIEHLRAAGYDLYQRGQTFGVISRSTKRKYRLKTLGLETAFQRAMFRKTAINKAVTIPNPKRKSASSEHSQNQLTNKQPIDPRAEALKHNRAKLNAQARDLLDGFERDEENER